MAGRLSCLAAPSPYSVICPADPARDHDGPSPLPLCQRARARHDRDTRPVIKIEVNNAIKTREKLRRGVWWN